MEKEKVLEIEITKINNDWSAITVKKIKKDFGNNDLFEWINIGGNYLYDRKIFINRIYPHIPFLIRNEIIGLLEDVVNTINEKYGIPKRWRSKRSDKYFSIFGDSEISEITDNYFPEDQRRYEWGNYFKTLGEAEKVKAELDKFWERVKAGEIGGDE